MKSITKFQSDDGSEWTTPEQALARDRLCREVNEAMALLPPRPVDRTLDRGERFLQHNRDVVLRAKQAIVDLAWRETGHEVFKHPAADIHPFSVAGRVLDDSGSPLNRAWWRFMCIDDQWREWEQPYFARNPNAAAVAV